MSRARGFFLLLLMGLGVFAVVLLLFGDSIGGGSAAARFGGTSGDAAGGRLGTSAATGLEAHGTRRPTEAEKAAEEARRAAEQRALLMREGVHGFVTNGRGDPVAGATVKMLPDPPELRNVHGLPDPEPLATATTDAKGAYVVGPNPADGYARLRAEARGYAPSVAQVSRKGARVDLVLDQGGGLELRLLDVKGHAVAGATALHSAGSVVTAATSGEDGVAHFAGLPTGTGHLVVTKPGYGAVRDNDVAVAPGAVEKRTMVMPAATRVRGRVVDAETEAPLAGSLVTVRYPSIPSLDHAGEHPQVKTDEDGRFEVQADVSGREQILLRVTHDGYAEAQARSNPQMRGDVEVKLRRAGEALQGSVVGVNRQPVAGARVTYSWMANADPGEVPEVTTDADGEFVLPLPGWAAPNSRWTLLAISEEGGMGSTVVRLPKKGARPSGPLRIELAGTGIVAGTVRDAGGAPRSGAVVSLEADWNAGRNRPGRNRVPWQVLRTLRTGTYQNLSAVTADDGTWRLENVPCVDYRVSASYGLEQVTLTDSISVTPGETTRADISLGDAGTIEGWVRDGEDKPVAGAYLRATPVRRGGGPMWRSSSTGRSQSDGKFVLRGISRDEYLVWASASGFGSVQEKNVERDTKDLTLRLKARGWIEGIVRLEGRPYRGLFTVTVVPVRRSGRQGVVFPGMWRPGQQTRTFNTDDGRFQVKGLGSGDYTVQATTNDGWIAAQQDVVTVVDGRASRRAELELTRGAVLSGVVRDDESGRPLPNAWVYANPARGTGNATPAPGGYSQTDARGHYEIRGLGTARYSIQVWVQGVSIGRSVDLTLGEQRTLDVAKMRPGTLTFHVVDEQGRPVPGARPDVRTASGMWVGVNNRLLREEGIIEGDVDWRALWETGDDGVLVRYHVPPGTCRVHVSRSGYKASSPEDVQVRSGANTDVRVTLTKKDA